MKILSPNTIIVFVLLTMLYIGWIRGGLAELKRFLAAFLGLFAIPLLYIPCSRLLLATGIFGRITSGLPETAGGFVTSLLLKFATFMLIAFASSFLVNMIPTNLGGSLGRVDQILGLVLAVIKICLICWLINLICTIIHIQILSDLNDWLMQSGIYHKLATFNYLQFLKNLR